MHSAQFQCIVLFATILKFHDPWDKYDILYNFSILQNGECISMYNF